MKKFFSFTILFILLTTAVHAQQASHESTPEVRQKTFQKVWKTTRDTFFDPTFGGLDWEKVRESYAPRVANVKSDAELYLLLKEMVDLLHVSHFEFVEPQTVTNLKQKPAIVGMALKMIDGQVVIWRVWPNSSVAESPLRAGYVIKSIDGTATNDVETAHKLMAGATETKLRVAYLDDKDELKEVTLERRLMAMDDIVKQDGGDGVTLYSIFLVRRLSDGIGYIHFSTFLTALEKHARAAIVSMHDAPGIIIDLRGNGGGEDSLGLAIAGELFDKSTLLMISRTRKGDDLSYKAKAQKSPYRGPIVILLDSESASASEQLAAGLQEVGRAVVIGNKTIGDDMDQDETELPTGALMLYPYGQPRTPKGVVIDGHGVIPDIEVSLSRKGLLEGDDAQISAAIQWIKQKSSKPRDERATKE